MVNGFPVEVGSEWSLETIRNSIGKDPHSSTISLESTDFSRHNIMERTQRGFSIIFSVTKAIAFFYTALHISHLALLY